MSSLDLTTSSSASSPGVKPTDRDDHAQKHYEISNDQAIEAISQAQRQDNSSGDLSMLQSNHSDSLASAGCTTFPIQITNHIANYENPGHGSLPKIHTLQNHETLVVKQLRRAE